MTPTQFAWTGVLATATAWDARLADNLGQVTLTAPLSAAIGSPVIDTVRRFGFAIVQSQPVDLTDAAIEQRGEALLAFAQALGTPIVQSPRRELVEDIKDFSDIDAQDDRGYRSGGELKPHSDPPTLIALHSVQSARHGGESSLVSVAAIVRQMAVTSPKLVNELFRPFPDWLIDGQYGRPGSGPSDEPRAVLAAFDQTLSCVLYRPFIELAADALSVPLSTQQIAALDLFEQCSVDPLLTLRFALTPGQTLVLHNRSVLHARSDYQDWPDFSRRRHLLRVWIDAPAMFPVHPSHELGDFFEPRAQRRS